MTDDTTRTVIFTVYCHTSPSGKRYVGQTALGMAKRWKAHVARSKHPRKCDAFARAIAKYGAANFTHEILQTCATQAEANDAEVTWVGHFDCMVPRGYNLHAGGRGRGFATDEAREKMRASARERRVHEAPRIVWMSLTHEERSKITREAMAAMSPEQRSECGRRSWASRDPAERAAHIQKMTASLTPEIRSASQRKAAANRTPEERSAILRKSHASRTQEVKTACGRAFWADKTPAQRTEIMRARQAKRRARERTERGQLDLLPTNMSP